MSTTPQSPSNENPIPSTAPSATELNSQFQSREIHLDQIDEPSNPERETMDEQELAELAVSIQNVGLLKPLIVEPRGDRFEVIAGHRRLLACRMVRYTPVPCRVKVNALVDPLSALVHENANVEKVNPIEEARFYHRVLVELAHEDVNVLAEMVKRRRDYLEGRLNLLKGHPRVIEALEQRKISIAVATALNKEHEEGRLMVYLDAAINQGATARQVEYWLREGSALGPLPTLPDSSADQATNPAAVQYNPFMVCMFCGTDEFPSMMELVWLHKPCKGIVRRALNLPDEPTAT